MGFNNIVNFNYVNVQHIDATEPILPNVQNWQTLENYTLNAIDPAFIVEGCMERFKLGGGIP